MNLAISLPDSWQFQSDASFIGQPEAIDFTGQMELVIWISLFLNFRISMPSTRYERLRILLAAVFKALPVLIYQAKRLCVSVCFALLYPSIPYDSHLFQSKGVE